MLSHVCWIMPGHVPELQRGGLSESLAAPSLYKSSSADRLLLHSGGVKQDRKMVSLGSNFISVEFMILGAFFVLTVAF